LGAVCKQGGKVDWSNDRSQYEITKALLKEDFDIHWEMSTAAQTHLCPSVARSLNYLLWVRDLLDLTRCLKLLAREATHDKVVGVDIGTGASCIFPLLGCRMNPAWQFVATDIDPESVSTARGNVEANGFQNRINLVLSKQGCYVGDAVKRDELENTMAFTMCNPPFFETFIEPAKEAAAPNPYLPAPKRKKLGKDSFQFHGTCNERSYNNGGEVGFFKEMFTESSRHAVKQSVTWFTCMFGMKASLLEVLDYLQQHDSGIRAIHTAALVQGKKKRWVLAWSFMHINHVQLGTLSQGKPPAGTTPLQLATLNTEKIHVHSQRIYTFSLAADVVWARACEFFLNRKDMSGCRVLYVLGSLPHEILAPIPYNKLRFPLFFTLVDGEQNNKVVFSFYMLIHHHDTESQAMELSLALFPCARGEFFNFCGKLEKAISRTSRKWRRAAKATENKTSC